jgi:hypothetical protein
VREMIDELGDDYRLRFAQSGATTATIPGKDAEAPDSPADAPHRYPLQKDCRVNIVVLPAHDEADEIVGLMLAQLLEFNNYCGTAVSQSALAGEMIEVVQTKNAHAVCVSALPPAAVAHSRYLCKRLHLKLPEMKMVVGLWGWSGDLKRAKDRVACEGSVNLVTTLAQALDEIEQVTHAVVVQQQEMARNGGGAGADGKTKTAAASASTPAPAK